MDTPPRQRAMSEEFAVAVVNVWRTYRAHIAITEAARVARYFGDARVPGVPVDLPPLYRWTEVQAVELAEGTISGWIDAGAGADLMTIAAGVLMIQAARLDAHTAEAARKVTHA